MPTALNQALLPQWVREDSRYAVSLYDIGLWAGPQSLLSSYQQQKAGWVTTSKTVIGADAQNTQDLIQVTYNGGGVNGGTETHWFLVANVATVLPSFIIDILTNAGYVLT